MAGQIYTFISLYSCIYFKPIFKKNSVKNCLNSYFFIFAQNGIMYKVIICDDEAPARESLSLIVKHHFSEKLTVVAITSSVREAVSEIHKHQPDIVFMDIEMPNEDGMSIFNYYRDPKFEVVFTTAHKQYSIEAFRKTAFDYLLKPVSFIDIISMLGRFEKKIAKKRSLPPSFESPISASSGKIALPSTDGLQLVDYNNIIYCHGVDNYTNVHTIYNGVILISKTLKSLDEQLSSTNFFRIHKSYVININHIKSYHKNSGYYVVMSNGEELSVAYRRNDEFVKMLKNL